MMYLESAIEAEKFNVPHLGSVLKNGLIIHKKLKKYHSSVDNSYLNVRDIGYIFYPNNFNEYYSL